jgi:hypothetical protein
LLRAEIFAIVRIMGVQLASVRQGGHPAQQAPLRLLSQTGISRHPRYQADKMNMWKVEQKGPAPILFGTRVHVVVCLAGFAGNWCGGV